MAGKADELGKLADLHARGVLSDKEFERQKSEVLQSTGNPAGWRRSHNAGAAGALGVAIALIVALVIASPPPASSKGTGVVKFQNASALSPATSAVRWAESMVGSPLGTSGQIYWYGCLAFAFKAYEQASYPIRSQVAVGITENTYPYNIWGELRGGTLGTDMSPPAGALVFWFSSGGVADSHVAISVGNGNLVSTNVGQPTSGPHGVPGANGIHYESMSQFQGNSWNIYKGWWLPTGIQGSSAVSPSPGSSSSANDGASTASGYWETTGGVAHTWSDYRHANGNPGPSIPANEGVQVTCKATGFRVADGNTWWYQVASGPWDGNYYVSADAFFNNGQTSGSLSNTPFVDSRVPDCTQSATPTNQPSSPAPAASASLSPATPTNQPSSPAPAASASLSPATPTNQPSSPAPVPLTYAETVGGVAHTWTDYSNAGGAEGPSIASNQTVQIACKVTGFRVTDGNTWWYRIASSPWVGHYYVSADAFYNNGETSGSLLNTPFVDNNVPNC